MSLVILPIDSASGAVLTIDYPHAQIHAGKSFFYDDALTLASAATQDYLITTPATPYCHMTFNMDGTATTSFALFEGADRTGTAAQTLYNANRTSGTTAQLTIHKGQSGGTTDGTQIAAYSSGTAQGSSKDGANLDYDHELILKRSTKYILRLTSGTNGNLCNVNLAWYEN